MDGMDYKLLKKINELAESLKNNRIAANMDEAVEMAKKMLTKTPAGEDMSTAALKEMESSLKEEEKELKDIEREVESIAVDKEMATEMHDKSASKEFVEGFEKSEKEVTEVKEELDALDSIKKDASEVAKKEKEAFDVEEKGEEKLPGEDSVE